MNITQLKKELGLTKITFSDGTTLRPNGELAYGIRAGSYGPLTVTDEWRKCNIRVRDQIVAKLKTLCLNFEVGDYYIKINLDSKKDVTLYLRDYRAYKMSEGLDDRYRNYFWTLQK